MTQTLEQLIDQLQPGEPIRYERMTVVPLVVPDRVAVDGPDYLTLEEATEANLADVEEKDASGSVPEKRSGSARACDSRESMPSARR